MSVRTWRDYQNSEGEWVGDWLDPLCWKEGKVPTEKDDVIFENSYRLRLPKDFSPVVRSLTVGDLFNDVTFFGADGDDDKNSSTLTAKRSASILSGREKVRPPSWKERIKWFAREKKDMLKKVS
jgi:hypothetical protein